MVEIHSKLLTASGTKKSLMFQSSNKFTFYDLIKWVYYNCPMNNKIVIEDTEVSAYYNDRVEVYWLVKNGKVIIPRIELEGED